MQFCLVNSPTTFHRMMDELLNEVLFRAYLEDVVIFCQYIPEHFDNPKKSFNLVHRLPLQLAVLKCEFAKRSVELLGHVVSAYNISTDHE